DHSSEWRRALLRQIRAVPAAICHERYRRPGPASPAVARAQISGALQGKGWRKAGVDAVLPPWTIRLLAGRTQLERVAMLRSESTPRSRFSFSSFDDTRRRRSVKRGQNGRWLF